MNSESSVKSVSYGKRIDFHTHMLPKMDDGSSSVEMSLQMIQTSLDQGVCCIVMTPHFYALRDNPQHFFEKRKNRLELLRSNYTDNFPLILAGAEVEYFEGITAMQDLSDMRIEKSNGLLIEMPMCKWSNRMIGDIVELNSHSQFQVILAHIERYLPFKNISAIRQLASAGVVMQMSADIFTRFGRSREVLKMLDEGLVHILGSDCHNTTTRPPNLADAYELIERKRGEAAVKRIINNGFHLLAAKQNKNEPASADMEFVF